MFLNQGIKVARGEASWDPVDVEAAIRVNHTHAGSGGRKTLKHPSVEAATHTLYTWVTQLTLIITLVKRNTRNKRRSKVVQTGSQ